jgi:hypothetical protein
MATLAPRAEVPVTGNESSTPREWSSPSFVAMV